eukprot:Blabericola_migrator_1__13073@NODE_884_length_6171_cov_178_211337_g624_i0_p3_GENE_NODE_884_length_6171_cov_178_211337_g624_i0NODE_884_length_6171_cov_178_211337_g624_i0_p3_ORF_typecomplete_len481_score64_68FAD_binding_4/PF01565_23/4_7e34BBE/PF08031_12/3_1e05_NODE_884_length_6171_cov_178_211337_g624_i043245766
MLALPLFLIVAAATSDANLQACLLGGKLKFLWRSEPGFAERITVHNGLLASNPSVVVRPDGVNDISKALLCAGQDKRVVTARSGGHSYGGYSRGMDNGVVLDLRNMDTITINTEEGWVEFEPGVRLGTLLTHLDRAGQYIVPGGTCPSVGAVGLTLGGGQGPLSPAYGMMSDNVLAMDLVLANGTNVTTSDAEFPDLFFAMRGAGTGNFGVVSKIRMKIHRIDQISWRFFTLTESFGKVMTCVATWSHSVSPRFGLALDLVKQSGTTGWLTYVGAPEDMDAELFELEACLPSLKAAQTETATSYLEPFFRFMALVYGTQYNTPEKLMVPAHYVPPPNGWARAHAVIGTGKSSQLGRVVERYMAMAPEGSSISVELLGGKINEVPAEETAFAHRNSTLLVVIFLKSSNGALPLAAQQWAGEFSGALYQHLGSYSYYNMLDPDLLDGNKFFGNNLSLLKSLSALYDPEDLFGFPSAIAALQA